MNHPNPSRQRPGSLRSGLALAAMLLAAAPAAGLQDAVTTAVFSQADKGYKRKKAPDGSWVREYYAMSNGGLLPGTTRDGTVDKVRFATLAGTLAEHLARQGYFPATEGREPDLLIVIHWGTTIPFSDGTYRGHIDRTAATMNALSEMNRNSQRGDPPAGTADNPPQAESSLTGSVEDMQRQAAADAVASQMITQDLFNKARDQANERNARLLGYLREINEANGIQRLAGGADRYNDLIGDLEESRYYVIISAYDFRRTVREKSPKLQWVTRVSIRSPGNSFDGRMSTMVANASRYFGRESGRLVRQYERAGTVEIGEATVVGTVPDAAVNERQPAAGQAGGKTVPGNKR